MTLFQRGFFIGLLVISFFATNYIYTHSRMSENASPAVVGENPSNISEIDEFSDMPVEDIESSASQDKDISYPKSKSMKKKYKKVIAQKSKVSREPSSVKTKSDVPWGRVPLKPATKK